MTYNIDIKYWPNSGPSLKSSQVLPLILLNLQQKCSVHRNVNTRITINTLIHDTYTGTPLDTAGHTSPWPHHSPPRRCPIMVTTSTALRIQTSAQNIKSDLQYYYAVFDLRTILYFANFRTLNSAMKYMNEMPMTDGTPDQAALPPPDSWCCIWAAVMAPPLNPDTAAAAGAWYSDIPPHFWYICLLRCRLAAPIYQCSTSWIIWMKGFNFWMR